MDFIIKKNLLIPCKCSKRYETIKDKQNIIKLRVYEGERLLSNKNKFLGEYFIKNIPKKQKGKVKINVSVDVIYIISIIAKLIDSNQINNINIKMNILSEDKLKN